MNRLPTGWPEHAAMLSEAKSTVTGSVGAEQVATSAVREVESEGRPEACCEKLTRL